MEGNSEGLDQSPVPRQVVKAKRMSRHERNKQIAMKRRSQNRVSMHIPRKDMVLNKDLDGMNWSRERGAWPTEQAPAQPRMESKQSQVMLIAAAPSASPDILPEGASGFLDSSGLQSSKKQSPKYRVLSSSLNLKILKIKKEMREQHEEVLSRTFGPGMGSPNAKPRNVFPASMIFS